MPTRNFALQEVPEAELGPSFLTAAERSSKMPYPASGTTGLSPGHLFAIRLGVNHNHPEELEEQESEDHFFQAFG